VDGLAQHDAAWEADFAESCAEMASEVAAFLKPFDGDAAAFLDHAEKVNNEGLRKIAKPPTGDGFARFPPAE
jgi:hypothetical protein